MQAVAELGVEKATLANVKHYSNAGTGCGGCDQQVKDIKQRINEQIEAVKAQIEVEKKLGFSGKQDIEEYGVEKFNKVCLESVHAYERQWREMSERIGFWIDLDSAVMTVPWQENSRLQFCKSPAII